MKLAEAIKLIQVDINDEDVEWDSPLGRAYKLSFEALKRIQDQRAYRFSGVSRLLPGETED